MCSTNGIYLECYYSYRSIGSLGSLYTCAAAVHPSVENRSVSDVTSNHLDDHVHDNVTALIFNETIAFTPYDIDSFFPNLVSIDLSDKGTSELTRASLKGLHRLKRLNFTHNQLQTIERDLFAENPELESLHFDGNPLRHVALNVFDLQRLSTLSMTETLCINDSATTIEAIDILKFRVLVNCPPTFEMLEEKIVGGSLMGKLLYALIEDNVGPIRNTVREVEAQQILLTERVDALEGHGDNLLSR